MKTRNKKSQLLDNMRFILTIVLMMIGMVGIGKMMGIFGGSMIGMMEQASVVGGSEWGSGMYPNAVAFGDTYGNGLEDSVGFAMHYSGANNPIAEVYSIGGILRYEVEDWMYANWYGMDIAFGNVDDDAADEFVVVQHSDTSQGDRKIRLYDEDGTDIDSVGGGNTGEHPTAVALGDMDGDGIKDMVGVAKHIIAPHSSEVYELYEIDRTDPSDIDLTLIDSPSDHGYWADNQWFEQDGTGIAFGNIDDDAGEEFVVSREKGSCNLDECKAAFAVFDDDTSLICEGGTNLFDDGLDITDVALGDMDGDGVEDTVGLAIKASLSSYKVYKLYNAVDCASSSYTSGISSNSGNFYATSIAFGDLNGDGKDEVGITMYKIYKSLPTWFIVDRNNKVIEQEGEEEIDPSKWGIGSVLADSYATDIAFGDMDGDELEDEIVVTMKADSGNRWYLYDFR